jgi:translation elongation factor EF-1alpha
MSLTGMVDKRTLEKYEREAREKSRESWYLSWALDTNQEGEFECFAFHQALVNLCNFLRAR